MRSPLRLQRARFALSLLVLSLWAGRASANVARGESDGQKHALLLARPGNHIQVGSVDLKVEVAKDLRAALVTTIYRLSNAAVGDEQVEMAHVCVAGEGDAGSCAPPEIWVDGRTVAFETREGAALDAEWGKLGESRPVTYSLFRVDFARGAERTVMVRHGHLPHEDYASRANTTYSYEYIMSQSRSWATFGRVRAEVSLPLDTWFDGGEGWSAQGQLRTVETSNGASGALSFRVMSTRGLLLGLTDASGYWAIALLIVALATVGLGIGAARRMGEPQAGCWAAGRRALGVLLLSLAVNTIVLWALSELLPERAFGFGYGPMVGFFFTVLFASILAPVVALIGARVRRGAALVCLPLVLFACDGPTETTASGGGGAGGNGGAGGASTTSTGTTTGTTGGGGTGGDGGAGGGGPVGTPVAYIGAGDGKIRAFLLDKATGGLSPIQEIEAGQSPSFLAFSPDKKYLYSVDEGQDAIRCFAIDPATFQLSPVNGAPSGGNGPAHIAVDKTGFHVFAVNYGSGDVRRINVSPGGGFGAGVTDVSTGANAHQIVLDAQNRFAFVPNKGSDNVSQLIFDEVTGTLDFNDPPNVPMPAGSGPRHLAFHPSAAYAYVIHELDDKITAFPYDAQAGVLGAAIQTVPTLPAGVDGGSNTCAEIALDPSGKHLYGSNRGHDSIVIYDVNAQSGMLALVGHQPVGGMTPRHFSIEESGEILLVGNQNSDEVRTFRVDAATGLLTELSVLSLPAGPAFVGVLYL